MCICMCICICIDQCIHSFDIHIIFKNPSISFIQDHNRCQSSVQGGFNEREKALRKQDIENTCHIHNGFARDNQTRKTQLNDGWSVIIFLTFSTSPPCDKYALSIISIHYSFIVNFPKVSGCKDG